MIVNKDLLGKSFNPTNVMHNFILGRTSHDTLVSWQIAKTCELRDFDLKLILIYVLFTHHIIVILWVLWKNLVQSSEKYGATYTRVFR